MTWRMILTLPLVLASLASCVSPGSECAGWEPITVADATVDWLAAHDPAMLRQVIAHAEFGQHQGCWK